MLPEQERSAERVEAEFMRIVQRALNDFRADATAFGFDKPPA
jgi:hypothetical protein